MKWVLIGTGVFVVLIVIVVAIGMALPVKHTVSRSASFAVPPESLWRAITTIPELPTWRKNLQKVEVLPDRNGHPVWRETDNDGSAITFEMIEAVPPKMLVTRIADTDLAFGGSWTYEINPSGTGSEITITENGEVYNPIFKFVSRFIIGHYGSIDDYLEGLKKVVR